MFNGQELTIGYKPDFVLQNATKEYIILESETSTSRKMYVGGMIKAARYLQNEKKGILVYVIKTHENTKVSSIAEHLKPYLNWVEGKTNLKDVYVIDVEKYYSNQEILPIDSEEFIKNSVKV